MPPPPTSLFFAFFLFSTIYYPLPSPSLSLSLLPASLASFHLSLYSYEYVILDASFKIGKSSNFAKKTNFCEMVARGAADHKPPISQVFPSLSLLFSLLLCSPSPLGNFPPSIFSLTSIFFRYRKYPPSKAEPNNAPAPGPSSPPAPGPSTDPPVPSHDPVANAIIESESEEEVLVE